MRIYDKSKSCSAKTSFGDLIKRIQSIKIIVGLIKIKNNLCLL